MTSKLVKQSLAAASIVTITVGLGGRIIGFVREATIASYYGTSATFDTFILAFTIPELVAFVLFASVPTAIIPWLSRKDHPVEPDTNGTFIRGAVLFAVIFSGVALLIWLLRDPLLTWLAPTLSPENRLLGNRLILVLSWYVMFRGMEAYFRGWLHYRKQFIVPAVSPVLLNLTILGAIIFLSGRFDIIALAYGFLGGSILLCLFNAVAALKLIGPEKSASQTSRKLGGLTIAIGSIAIIELISLAYPTVDRYLASRYLGEGQIAALRYASNLVMLAPGILVVTFSTASYPWLSELGQASCQNRLQTLYSESIRMICFAILPIAVCFVFFGEEIVRIAFQRGSFSWQSASLTSSAFRLYAAGLLFYSTYIYQMRFYYAGQRLLRLGTILLIMTSTKILGSLILIKIFEHDGLAMASAIAWTIGFIVMSVDLKKQVGMPGIISTLKPMVRLIPSIVVLVVVWYIAVAFWPVVEPVSFEFSLLRLALIASGGGLVYFGLAWLFGLNEPRKLLKKLTPGDQ